MADLPSVPLTQAQPFDMSNGINAAQGVLGLQQQRQALQTGQYQQATAQADSQQAQQRNSEMQAVGNLTKNAFSSGRYKDQDGNFDNQKFAADVAMVAPAYGQQIANAATARAGELYQNQQTLLNLTNDQRKTIGSTLGALATKPDVHHSDVVDALDQLREQIPGKQASRLIQSMGGGIDPSLDGPTLQAQLRKMALMTNAPNASESAPQVSQFQGKGGMVPINTNPQAPGGVGQIPGALPAQGITPQLTTAPNKQAAIVGPSGALTAAGGDQSLNPNAQEQIARTGSAAGVTDRVQQAQAAANNTVQAQDALSRARNLLDSPGAPTTGANFESFKALKNTLASLGIDTQGADDANTLTKNLARYEASRATQAGLGGTDAARELAHAGSPNTTLDNKALKGIVTQSLATEKALAGYAKIQAKNANDPNALVKNESDFRNIPNLVQGYEYGLARNPKEADEFLSKHGISKADMAKTRQAIKEFESR